jgi:predicted nucleic acid-binding protein
MKCVVVDTSVLVKWLNQTDEEDIEKADVLLQSAFQGEVQLIAPELAKYELGNVLLKGKQLNSEEGAISLSTFYALPVDFIAESEEIAQETYSLSFHFGITYYDAAFISLAKQKNAILVTENIKHQGKTKDITVKSLREY